MEQSQEIKDLATALSKAQKEIKGAVKDSENPYFKSQYADLTSVWEACRKALTENNLSVIQNMAGQSADTVTVETMLCHSSGQWVRGALTMKPTKADPQGIGSAITYARRYALAAMVGVCPEDDDGQAASQRPTATKSNPVPQADLGRFSDYVVSAVKSKSGKHKDGKPWQAYIITTQDNGDVATYEEKVYSLALTASSHGELVTFEAEPGKFGPVIKAAMIQEVPNSVPA